jgi:hypothetical protein
MSDPERFRQEAQNCLRLEAEAVDATDRAALLWMAGEWLKLAQAASLCADEYRPWPRRTAY